MSLGWIEYIEHMPSDFEAFVLCLKCWKTFRKLKILEICNSDQINLDCKSNSNISGDEILHVVKWIQMVRKFRHLFFGEILHFVAGVERSLPYREPWSLCAMSSNVVTFLKCCNLQKPIHSSGQLG